MLIAADEEGGTVVRSSSNPNLVSQKFKSPSELYGLGGFDRIRGGYNRKKQYIIKLRSKFEFSTSSRCINKFKRFYVSKSIRTKCKLTAEYA